MNYNLCPWDDLFVFLSLRLTCHGNSPWIVSSPDTILLFKNLFFRSGSYSWRWGDPSCAGYVALRPHLIVLVTFGGSNKLLTPFKCGFVVFSRIFAGTVVVDWVVVVVVVVVEVVVVDRAVVQYGFAKMSRKWLKMTQNEFFWPSRAVF